jgi:hypothetical protein
MKLRLIKPVSLGIGYEGLTVGDVFEHPSPWALVGYVEEVQDEPPVETPRPVVDPFTIETREPVVENRDPKKKLKQKLP